MTFLRNVLGTFATDILIVGLNVLLGILTARLLGPERRGILTLVMTLPLTLVHFADLGISQANVFLIGRRGRSAASIATNSLALALLGGGGVAVVLWLARDLALDELLHGVPIWQFLGLMLLVPFLLLYTYWMAIPRAWERFRMFNLLRLLMPVSLLVCMTPALLVFRGDLGWATGTYLGSTLLVIAVSLIGIMGLVHRQAPLTPRVDFRLARESLGYGLKSYLQNLVGHLAYRLDVYLVALFLQPGDVAFYAIAVSIAELSWHIPNSVGLVLFSKLSNEAEERIHPLTAEVCRHTFIITFLATIGVLAVGTVAVPLLYGRDYAPAVPALLALGPGIVAMSLYKVLTRNFSSRDRQQVSVVVALAGLVLNVVLDVVLIPRLGIVGAALASSSAYSVMGLALLFAFHRESRLSWGQILRPRRADLARYVDAGRRIRASLRGGRAAVLSRDRAVVSKEVPGGLHDG